MTTKLVRTVSRDGDGEYWATDDLGMQKEKGEALTNAGWGIEVYHRGIKQCCGVEKAQVRKADSIINHIQISLRAFLRLELYRLVTGISWYEAKARIIRDAIRAYLLHPVYLLAPTRKSYPIVKANVNCPYSVCKAGPNTLLEAMPPRLFRNLLHKTI